MEERRHLSNIQLKIIGEFHADETQPYELPRQPLTSEAFNQGSIHLHEDFPLECLSDLEFFDRIWVLFLFDRNSKWQPKVQPPRGHKKRGVFATRAPHRPNPIGMTCVELDSIDGRVIKVRNHDILNQSPILDIKPYIPYCDSFPESSSGWLEGQTEYKINFADLARQQISWIEKETGLNLQKTLLVQLSTDPLNFKRKRVEKDKSTDGEFYIFSVRTWRFQFQIEDNRIIVTKCYSGYSYDELLNEDDPHGDKELHRHFLSKF